MNLIKDVDENMYVVAMTSPGGSVNNELNQIGKMEVQTFNIGMNTLEQKVSTLGIDQINVFVIDQLNPRRRFASAEGFAEYMEMTGKDKIPENLVLDAVYVFTLPEDLQREAAESAVEMYEQRKAKKIIINDATTQTGYSGVDFVKKLLIDKGVPEDDIITIKLEGPLNTKTETKPLIDYCIANNIKNIAVSSAPVHYRRAFVSTVTRAIEGDHDSQLNIWTVKILEKDYDWKKEKAHSQGTLSGSGITLTQEEMSRMYAYTENKSLKPWSRIKEYMLARDKRVSAKNEQ